MLKRVLFGVGANVFDKAVIAAMQFASVSVLARAWGLDVFGFWVLLSTIPVFLVFSDLGFATAAGVKMAMLVAEDRRTDAVRVYQSAWIAITCAAATIGTITVAIVWTVPDSTFGSPAPIPPQDARLTLTLLIFYGLVALQDGVILAGFRSDRLFAVGSLCTGVMILFENVCSIIVVGLGGSPVAAAATLLCCRPLGVLGEFVILKRLRPWIRFGVSQATAAEVKSLIRPAMAVMGLPVAQACSLQGTAMALGVGVSQAAVPSFTTARTLSRIALQATATLNTALLPEFSAAHARRHVDVQTSILVLTVITSALVAIPFAAFLAFFGTAFVDIWTGGVVRPTQGLMLVMGSTVLLGSFWNPVSNLIVAINRQETFSYILVVLAVATVPLAYALGKIYGPTGAALALLAFDASMFGVVAVIAYRLFGAYANLQTVGPLVTAHIRGAWGRVSRRR